MLMVLVNVLSGCIVLKDVWMAEPAAIAHEILGALPSVSFKTGSNALSNDAKAVLAAVAAKIA